MKYDRQYQPRFLLIKWSFRGQGVLGAPFSEIDDAVVKYH